MLRIADGQVIPTAGHSRAKILFVCDCGRQKLISWKNYTTNHTKSCGNCKSDKWAGVATEKYNSLRAEGPLPSTITKRTMIAWRCDCGNIKEICVGSVVGGLTKSCGKCRKKVGHSHVRPIIIDKQVWLGTIKELVDTDGLPDGWSRKSGIVCWFRCQCSRIYERKFCKWSDKSTCGRCNEVDMDDLLGKDYGRLTICDERKIVVSTNSQQKVSCRCSCGNIKDIQLSNIIDGYTTSCGRCNEKPASWWTSQKFGRLKVIEVPPQLKIHSEQLLRCLCSCGSLCEKEACALTSEHASSCGQCHSRGVKWWSDKQSVIRGGTSSVVNKYDLSYLREYFHGSYLLPTSGCNSSNDYCHFTCLLCGNSFRTKLTWIWHHKIVSCGCATVSSSRASNSIGDFIVGFGIDAVYGKNEHKIGKYKIDVFVPDRKTVIELNGLRFHQGIDRRDSYVAKYKTCLEAGMSFMMFYEDEWRYKRHIVESIIKHRLGVDSEGIGLRPSAIEYEDVDAARAAAFHADYHYQGGCPASIHIGAKYKGDLIACMSIRRPSRQNAGDYEIARMSRCNQYNVRGLWSHMMAHAVKIRLPHCKLVTYSDNRIMSGGVYAKMGFSVVGSVRPDYYWTDLRKRFHKSALRKSKIEQSSGLTETELRTAAGLYKIYDLGKTKWAIAL